MNAFLYSNLTCWRISCLRCGFRSRLVIAVLPVNLAPFSEGSMECVRLRGFLGTTKIARGLNFILQRFGTTNVIVDLFDSVPLSSITCNYLHFCKLSAYSSFNAVFFNSTALVFSGNDLSVKNIEQTCTAILNEKLLKSIGKYPNIYAPANFVIQHRKICMWTRKFFRGIAGKGPLSCSYLFIYS